MKSVHCRLPGSGNVLHARLRIDRAPAPADHGRRQDPADGAHRAEMERLERAHGQSLRYANDLKVAYEAERERRMQLAQTTLGLLAVLAALTEAPGSGDQTPGESDGVAA